MIDLFCVLWGHQDVVVTGQQRLAVRCWRCQRESVGIDMSDLAAPTRTQHGDGRHRMAWFENVRLRKRARR